MKEADESAESGEVTPCEDDTDGLKRKLAAVDSALQAEASADSVQKRKRDYVDVYGEGVRIRRYVVGVYKQADTRTHECSIPGAALWRTLPHDRRKPLLAASVKAVACAQRDHMSCRCGNTALAMCRHAQRQRCKRRMCRFLRCSRCCYGYWATQCARPQCSSRCASILQNLCTGPLIA